MLLYFKSIIHASYLVTLQFIILARYATSDTSVSNYRHYSRRLSV
jgi:hypothetical protein